MKPALSLIVLGFALASCSSVPTFAPESLPSAVTVTDQGGWIVLLPSSVPTKTTGLIFYPGGLVKPEAYLKALAPLAVAGFPVVVPKMPFDLAFFDSEKGLSARSSVPTVKTWAIGGHSLGGVAASMAVKKHPEVFAGLVFWASYPSADSDLSAWQRHVLSVSATQDGLSTPAKVEAAARLLPSTTQRLVLEGGIHSQFGDYGPQKGDGSGSLSREEQQAATAQATVEFLEMLTVSP